MLVTNPIFWKPFQPRIDIKNLANNTTYYSFDAFADVTTNKVVYCKVDIGLDHHGTFEIQIENSNQALDTTNIKKGQRVFIYIRKDSTLGQNAIISGLIRKTGYSRGIGGQALYTLQGSSIAIRFNEIITYFVREAAKLAQDGITIDITDANMKADTLLQSLLNITEAYNASTIAAASDVENFIPSMAIEFGELQDGINVIEEQSNGECFIDMNSDTVLFRHQLQPGAGANSGRGFILKDVPSATDDAAWTGYIDGTPEYSESIYKSDGFSSRVYGILPAETVPSSREDVGFLSTGNNAGVSATQELAQKFRPTHSHFLAGDIIIVGGQQSTVANIPAWAVRMRVCTDTGGVPTNAGGVIANIDYIASQFKSDVPALTQDSFIVLSEQIFYNSANARIDSFDLDTSTNYWLIMSNDNIPTANQNHYWGSKTGGTGAMITNGTMSSNSAGGAGWASPGNTTWIFAMPRRRSIAFECSDSKAIAATGSGHTTIAGAAISSTLTNVPAIVKTKEAMYKYLSNQLYYMARPQVTWSTLRINPPNNPILPNDPLLIVDSTLHFSTAGTQAVTATTGAMSYEFGSRGGTGNSLQTSLYLNITPVGYASHY